MNKTVKILLGINFKHKPNISDNFFALHVNEIDSKNLKLIGGKSVDESYIRWLKVGTNVRALEHNSNKLLEADLGKQSQGLLDTIQATITVSQNHNR